MRYYLSLSIASTTNEILLAVTALEPLDTSTSGGGGTSLTISDCEEILTDAHLGDSIAVNGNFELFYTTGTSLRRFEKRNMSHGDCVRQDVVQGRLCA